MGTAAILGRFLGAVLAEMAPVLVEIIRAAMQNTVEDGATRDDLRERLLQRVRDANEKRLNVWRDQ